MGCWSCHPFDERSALTRGLSPGEQTLYRSEDHDKRPTRWMRPPDSIICSRCSELGVDVLLERHVLFEGLNKTRSWSRIYPEQPAMPLGTLYGLSGSYLQESFLIIAQRLLFDQERLLHAFCAACQTLKRTFWRSRVKPTFCSPQYGKEYFFLFDIRGNIDSEIRLDTDKPGYKTLLELGHSGSKLEPRHLAKVLKVPPNINYDLLKSWLKHCQDDHSKCAIVPTSLTDKLKNVRLLDVWERRLVSYTAGTKYLALSYVWGGEQQPVINKNSGVPLALPLTVEHAIMMVRELDHRYLWVDSICIDQSNPIEKSEQIAVMDAIYSCASVTLITLDSPCASSGIPGIVPTENTRNPRTQQMVAVFQPHSKEKHPRTDSRISLVGHHPTLEEELEESPWSTRAWTYQEAILSPRRIFIGRHQVFFSCLQADFSEDGYDVSRCRPLGSLLLHNLANPFHRADLSSGYGRFVAYVNIVLDYAKRQLTNEEDGLRAISAVLSTWERELSCEKFVYALPGWAFRNALLWYHRSENMFRPSKGRRMKNLEAFPSWSWCGWQLNHLVDFLDYERLATQTILPPLFVSHHGNILISNCGDDNDRNELGLLGVNDIDYESLVWKTLSKVAEPDHELRAINISNDRCLFPCTSLTVRGILLRMPFKAYGSSEVISGFPHGSGVYLDVQGLEIMSDRLVFHYDCLLISIGSPSSIRMCCIILLWKESAQEAKMRTARRGGVFHVYFPNQEELLEMWPSLHPRWERFYLS